MARSSTFESNGRDAYVPHRDRGDRYGQRGSAPEPRSRRHDDYSQRPSHRRDDSYYDPRDKYYLSSDEDQDIGFRGSSSHHRDSSRRSTTPSRISSADRYGDSARRDSSEATPSHSSYSRNSRPRSGAGGRGRESVDRDHRDRYYPPSAGRNKDVRAGKRPGTSRTNSSSRSLSSSDRSKSGKGKADPQKKENGLISSAMRCALEAGAVAALKQRNDPSPWIGMKGTKVAAAAIGAAAIDTFMDRKAPKRKGGMSHAMMRQATTMALGNLVLGPVAKGTVMGRTGR